MDHPVIKTQCAECSLFYDNDNFCAKLSGQELCDLSDKSRPSKLKRGETIDRITTEKWPIIGITSGVVSLQHLLEDGRKTIAALFMRGDIIDLRSVGKRHHGKLVALSKSGICRLAPDVFEDIVAANPKALHLVWENLREQALRATDHSADISKKHAQEKLASFIFECSHRQSEDIKDGSVKIPIRRCDLAEYLGMQPETVSRCFHDLEDRKIVRVQKLNTIIINNLAALRRIANGDKDASGVRETKPRNIQVLKSA